MHGQFLPLCVGTTLLVRTKYGWSSILRLNSILVYFLPIWLQAVKGVSAADSGIRTLPLMLSMVLASIIGGTATTKIGYYTPFAIVGSCIMVVGAGLLTTLEISTDAGKWIGYQIVYGFGLGLCMQVPALAAQASLPKPDVPMGIGLILFSTLLGAAVYVSVGESIMVNQLASRLSEVAGIDHSLLTSSGATSLFSSLPDELKDTVLTEYNEALRVVFLAGLIPCCLSVPGCVSLEWNSVKKPENGIQVARTEVHHEKTQENGTPVITTGTDIEKSHEDR